jgi:hypothetical protein
MTRLARMEAKFDKIIEILRHRKHDPEIAGPVLRKKRPAGMSSWPRKSLGAPAGTV